MVWTPQRPDLSVMESVWDHMKRHKTLRHWDGNPQNNWGRFSKILRTTCMQGNQREPSKYWSDAGFFSFLIAAFSQKYLKSIFLHLELHVFELHVHVACWEQTTWHQRCLSVKNLQSFITRSGVHTKLRSSFSLMWTLKKRALGIQTRPSSSTRVFLSTHCVLQ